MASDVMALIGVCMISSKVHRKQCQCSYILGFSGFLYNDSDTASGQLKFQARIPGSPFEYSPNMLCLALSLSTFELSVTAVVSLSMIRRLCCHTVVRVQYSL